MRTARLVILVGAAVAAASCNRADREAVLAGHASFRDGEFAQALSFYDQALALDPDAPEALEGRGRALAELGRLDEALVAFDRLVELLPYAASAHFDRGAVLSEMSTKLEDAAANRRLGEAQAAFQRATELEPENAEIHFRLGLTRSALGLAGAISSYDRALELQPDHAGAHLYRGIALATDSPEEALRDLDRAVALDPGDPHAHYWRAFVLQGLGRFDDAAVALDRAVELGADDLYPGLAAGLREAILAGTGAGVGPATDTDRESR